MQNVEDYVAEKRDKKQSNRGEDRAEDLSAINLWPAECTEQTDYQQRDSNSKEQEIRPWKIASDWKACEKLVTEQTADRANEADPKRPVPFPLHVDLADAIRKVQR